MLASVRSEGDKPGSLRYAQAKDGSRQTERLETYDPRRHSYEYVMQEGGIPVANYVATFRIDAVGQDTSSVTWQARFDTRDGDTDAAVEAVRTFIRSGLDNLERQYSPLSPIQQRLLGSWRLLSWNIRDADGTLSYPLGEEAIGQLSYDASGRMSAQLVRPRQTQFAANDWRQASSEEKARAWSNYFGYFGTYGIDEEAGAVIHHIEGSWFPNLEGGDETRYFRFEGSRLLLEADTAWGHVGIVWEKIDQTG